MVKYSAASLNNWVGNNYMRMNMLSVARNSRGVYDLLHKQYRFPFNWARGTERSDVNSKRMVDELNKLAVASGNPLAFARMINSKVPMTDMYRDTIIVNRIEKLLRENP